MNRSLLSLFFTVIVLGGCNSSSVDNLGHDSALTIGKDAASKLTNVGTVSLSISEVNLDFIDIVSVLDGGDTAIKDDTKADLIVKELNTRALVKELKTLDTKDLTAEQWNTLLAMRPINLFKYEIPFGEFRIPDLREQTFYLITSSACYKEKCTEASLVFVRTPQVPLAESTLTSVTAVDSTRVDLKWKTSGGADFYRIQRKEQSDSSDWSILIDDTLAKVYTDSTVSSKQSYIYRVQACQYSGIDINEYQCKDSEEKAVYVPQNYKDLSFPSANITVSAGLKRVLIDLKSLNNNNASDSDASDDVSLFYFLQVETSGGYSTLKVFDNSQVDQSNDYAFEHDNLELSTTYKYRVSACFLRNMENCYRWYEFRATTLTPPPAVVLEGQWGYGPAGVPPEPPHYFWIWMELSWQSVTGVSSYEVHEKEETSDYKRIAVLDSNKTKYLSASGAGNNKNTRYQYKVLSCFTAEYTECKNESNVVSGKTPYLMASLTPIENVNVTASTQGLQLTISWDAFPPNPDLSPDVIPDFYTLEYKKSTDNTWTRIGGSITSTSYVHNNLEGGKTYQYRVSACQATQYNCTLPVTASATLATQASTASSSISFKDDLSDSDIISVAIPAPQGLITKSSANRIDLSWDGVDQADGYSVYWDISDSVSPTYYLSMKNVTTSSTTISNLIGGRTYYFAVTAYTDTLESQAVKVSARAGASQPLNDTGITYAGSSGLGNSIDCTSDIDAWQDCHRGRDATNNDDSDGQAGFSFTKLDGDGNQLDSSASDWSCVRDNVSSLVWEVKDNDSSSNHYVNKYYRWGGETAIGKDRADKKGNYYDDWNSLVEGANNEALCGYSDWRVPSLVELLSIQDLSKTDLWSMDSDYFPDKLTNPDVSDLLNKNQVFWTSSPAKDIYGNADLSSDQSINFSWTINGKGESYRKERDKAYRVRLVSGGSAAYSRSYIQATPVNNQSIDSYITNEWQDDRYLVDVDNTVIDSQTGLMWKRCIEGLSGNDCATGAAQQYTWQGALVHAQEHTFAGYSDWRVPNIKELTSLLALDRSFPSINASVFPNTQSSSYWTSSPKVYLDSSAWMVDFEQGIISNSADSSVVLRSTTNRMRLVRGGE